MYPARNYFASDLLAKVGIESSCGREVETAAD
jgi:hypothetical protein